MNNFQHCESPDDLPGKVASYDRCDWCDKPVTDDYLDEVIEGERLRLCLDCAGSVDVCTLCDKVRPRVQKQGEDIWACERCLSLRECDTHGRRLTRTERLQGLADSGCDTWEEYRGEK